MNSRSQLYIHAKDGLGREPIELARAQGHDQCAASITPITFDVLDESKKQEKENIAAKPEISAPVSELGTRKSGGDDARTLKIKRKRREMQEKRPAHLERLNVPNFQRGMSSRGGSLVSVDAISPEVRALSNESSLISLKWDADGHKPEPRFEKGDIIHVQQTVDGIRTKIICTVSERRLNYSRRYWEYRLVDSSETAVQGGTWHRERELRLERRGDNFARP